MKKSLIPLLSAAVIAATAALSPVAFSEEATPLQVCQQWMASDEIPAEEQAGYLSDCQADMMQDGIAQDGMMQDVGYEPDIESSDDGIETAY